MNPQRAASVSALVVGVLFGAGLVISGMSNPDKVLNFLDLSGPWDPTLLVVMGAALVTTFVAYRAVLGRAHPLFASSFSLPTKKDIDGRLIGGAVLFGIGWGIAGYCPGPLVTAVALGASDAVLVCLAMIVGFWIVRKYS